MGTMKFKDDNEKIVYVVKDIFNATTPENGVTMEQIVEKGIELGLTETYPRGKKDGHPWWPRTSVMMGVGSVEAVMANEEVHLHRKNVKKEGEKGNVMIYWFDKKTKHEIIGRNTKSQTTKKITKNPNVVVDFGDIIHRRSVEENIAKYNADPTKYMLTFDGKLLLRSWVETHPENAKKLYGISL